MKSNEYLKKQYNLLVKFIGNINADEFHQKEYEKSDKTEESINLKYFELTKEISLLEKLDYLKLEEDNDIKNPIQVFKYYKITQNGWKFIEYYENKIGDRKDKIKWFLWGSLVSIIAALVGVTPTIIEKARKEPQELHIVLPKGCLIHDTIMVHEMIKIK